VADGTSSAERLILLSISSATRQRSLFANVSVMGCFDAELIVGDSWFAFATKCISRSTVSESAEFSKSSNAWPTNSSLPNSFAATAE
jgi:hypothetical protein